MHLPSYFYSNRVVGWRQNAPVGLQSLLRKVVEYDLRADRAKKQTRRKRAYSQKDEALLAAYRQYPSNFILLREGSCIAFVSKIGYPGSSRNGRCRTKAHLPLRVLERRPGWSRLRSQVLAKARRNHNRKYRTNSKAALWPESRGRYVKPVHRLPAHHRRSRAVSAPALA